MMINFVVKLTMIMKLRKAITLCAVAMAMTASAYPTTEDARLMAEDGNIAGAISALNELLEAEPKNIDARLLLGRLAWSVGEDALACSTLEEARRQGSRDATFQLAEIAVNSYDFDRASSLLDGLLKTGGRRGRKALPVDERAAELKERMEHLQSMMGRVEKIAVIDSVNVDADTFLSAYRLSPESGSLSSDEGTVVFMPQSRRQKIWAEADSAGTYRLMQADALLGDEWEAPVTLDDALGAGGDVDYPFLMPDGITLYYASDGDGSLGGYDIFMARRTDEGFLEPVNLGMPYNSPYNDFMMAVDEVNGVGWFASDRNRIPGKVTVYMFVPSEMRVNVDADDPALRARAFLSSISATQDGGKDYDALLKAVRSNSNTKAENNVDFMINIPGRGVVTSFSQLGNEQARHMAEKYVRDREALVSAEERLSVLRADYAGGNERVASEIRALEGRLPQLRVDLQQVLNSVIRAELQ